MDVLLQKKTAHILKHRQISQTREIQQFLHEILSAKRELDTVTHNIDFTNDELLLDHYIFKRKACEMRYRYLINKAKERGINYNEYARKMAAERYSR